VAGWLGSAEGERRRKKEKEGGKSIISAIDSQAESRDGRLGQAAN